MGLGMGMGLGLGLGMASDASKMSNFEGAGPYEASKMYNFEGVGPSEASKMSNFEGARVGWFRVPAHVSGSDGFWQKRRPKA